MEQIQGGCSVENVFLGVVKMIVARAPGQPDEEGAENA
jgi:hypothetical protein